MATIQKRGNSYLPVVSMGYDSKGNRIKPKQKTIHPPERRYSDPFKYPAVFLQSQLNSRFIWRSCKDFSRFPRTFKFHLEPRQQLRVRQNLRRGAGHSPAAPGEKGIRLR